MTTPPATDAVEPEATAPALPTRPVRGGRFRRLRRFRFAAFVLFGIAAGTLGRSAFGGPKPAPTEPHARADTPEAPHPEETAADRIDLALRVGRFPAALKLIHAAPPHAFGADGRALAYREGLCLEGLRQWDAAAAAYKKAAVDDGDVAAWARATLGHARCATAAGDARTAGDLLNRVLVRSGHPACRDRNVLGECLYLRARLALHDLGPRPAPDPLDDRALAWPPLDGGLDDYLAWLPEGEPSASAGPPAPAARGEIVEVFRTRWAPGVAEVTARFAKRPTADALSAVAAAAGLTIRADGPTAARLAAGRQVALDVESAPLAEVMTALTDSLGLEWRTDGAALVVGPATPADPAARRVAAGAALRRAVAVAPDHPAARAARVTLSNLDHEGESRRRAADGFRRFLADEPNAPEAAHAAYNLGLLELADGNLPAARAQWAFLIDHDPRAQWAGLGWWWAARTHLDAGDTAAARKPLDLARAGPSKEVAAAAVLGQCLCHLLDGDDDAARELMRGTRTPDRAAYLDTSGWFGALLRHRTAPTDDRAGELRTALAAGGDGRALGPAGALLAGRAYRESGRPDSAVRVYEAAAAVGRGPLAVRMTFEAAEFFAALDRRAAARTRFLAVAAADPDGLGPRAGVRVAELAARDGRGAECVRRCRAAAGRPGVELDELLPVMGRGFELEGKYRLAAECFAGRLPAE